MTVQLSMFGGPVQPKDRGARAGARKRASRPSIDERFATFHLANPHVFERLLRLARMRVASGETRIAVKALWEELRVALMRQDITEHGDDIEGERKHFKLDNSYTSSYARMLVRYPELKDVIEIRRRKGER